MSACELSRPIQVIKGR